MNNIKNEQNLGNNVVSNPRVELFN